jgi:hypothetical protein
MINCSKMEPEMTGSHLDKTIETEITALKKMAEEFTMLQYQTRTMRIMVSESAHTFMDNMGVVFDIINH